MSSNKSFIPEENKELFFTTLITESMDGILVIDKEGIVQFANPAAKKLFSEKAANLEGYHFGLPAINQRVEIVLPFESAQHTIELYARRITWQGQTAHLAMLRDVTDRVRSEQALHEKEQWLEDTSRLTKVGACRLEPEPNTVWLDPICREIFAVDADYDPNLTDILSFFPEEARAELAQAIERARNECIPYELELPFVNAKGEDLWVHVIDQPVIEDGKVVSLKGIFQDITQQHIAQEALAVSERRYRQLFDHAMNGFAVSEVVYGDQGEVIDFILLKVNREFEKQLGISWEQAIDKSVIEVIPGIRNTPVWDVLIEVAKTGTPQNLEIYSDIFDRYFFISVYKYAEGQLAVMFNDITDRINIEQALKQNEKKFRQMFQNSINGSALHEIILDDNGKPVNFIFLDANAAFETHTGIRPEDAIGKLATEALPGIEDTDLIDVYGRIALTGESKRFEIYYEPLDRHFMITAFSPEPRQFVTIFSDISERIKAEQALQQSENRYRMLFENAFNGFVLVEMVEDNEGNPTDFIFLEMNAAFEKQIGLVAKDVLNKRASKAAPDILRTNLIEQLDRVKKSGEAQQYELFVPGCDRYFLVSSYIPVEGQVASITHDITEQIKAEALLRKNEEKYRTLFEAMSQGVIYYNAEGKVVSINPAAEHILGITAQDLFGRSPEDPLFPAFRMNGDPLSGEQHPVIIALRTGKKVENFSYGTFNPKRKDLVWLNISAIPQFHEGEDKPYQVFTTFLEITDQVRVQKALEERINELRCLSRVSAIIQENHSS